MAIANNTMPNAAYANERAATRAIRLRYSTPTALPAIYHNGVSCGGAVGRDASGPGRRALLQCRRVRAHRRRARARSLREFANRANRDVDAAIEILVLDD